MNQEQLKRMKEGKGFIAALDQSGGSTPKALKAYGIDPSKYTSEEEMFELIHEMRTRMIKTPSFNKERILAVILFERTMRSKIDGALTADYCWNTKGIVPFLKVDKGLEEEHNGVQLMKPFPELANLLKDANKHNIFGTKMRSVIKSANREGIKAVVAQQFEWAGIIADHDLVPIIEPEVDINAPDKEEAEKILKEEILLHLEKFTRPVMLKLTIPTKADFYKELIEHSGVVRVVALSGGYSREHANELLSKNHGMIASFSRALAEDLTAQLSNDEFDKRIGETIEGIYQASIS